MVETDMVEENLKIEEYRLLLEQMGILCSKMPEIIFLRYFDSNKYLYSLYNEAFNSIKGFCVLLGNGALISQACTILRMAIERTATIRVLITNKNLITDYVEHCNFRFKIKDEENKAQLIKKHYNGKINIKNENPMKFLEYGWLKPLTEQYGLDALIELSKIQEQNDAIKNWKNQLNQWTHGIIEFTNIAFYLNGPLIYSQTLIEMAAKLLDILICDFHNENRFNFKFDGVDYRELFLNAYKKIINKNV